MYSRWSDVITLVICFFVFCFLGTVGGQLLT